MNTAEKIHKKKLLDNTIHDMEIIESLYKQIDDLSMELHDHELNGRGKESNNVLNKLLKLNKEITQTENRIRTRLDMKKI